MIEFLAGLEFDPWIIPAKKAKDRMEWNGMRLEEMPAVEEVARLARQGCSSKLGLRSMPYKC